MPEPSDRFGQLAVALMEEMLGALAEVLEAGARQSILYEKFTQADVLNAMAQKARELVEAVNVD